MMFLNSWYLFFFHNHTTNLLSPTFFIQINVTLRFINMKIRRIIKMINKMIDLSKICSQILMMADIQ